MIRIYLSSEIEKQMPLRLNVFDYSKIGIYNLKEGKKQFKFSLSPVRFLVMLSTSVFGLFFKYNYDFLESSITIFLSIIRSEPMRSRLCSNLRRLFTEEETKQLFQEYDQKITMLRNQVDGPEKRRKLLNINKEINIKFQQFEDKQKLTKIKKYLLEDFHIGEEDKPFSQRQTQKKGYIPNNLIVKKLKFLDKKILLLGVEQENEEHCIYLKRMAEKFSTKIILTAMSPDMPYFIKSEASFGDQWAKFLKSSRHSKQSKFYLNPTPSTVSQSCLNKAQIDLVRKSLSQSKQFNEIFYTFLQNYRHNKFLPNALLTPLLINNIQKLYFCDFPLLKERQFWALNVPLNKMRQLFNVYHTQVHTKKQFNYDPRILFPKAVISRKFEQMSNAVKYASYQAKQPVIFVCPSEYAEMFCLQFKLDKPVTEITRFMTPLSFEKEITFIEFLEKLVMMDLMLQPIIQKYFIKYKSFPYTGFQTIGGRQNIGKIFLLWKHYYNTYVNILNGEPKD